MERQEKKNNKHKKRKRKRKRKRKETKNNKNKEEEAEMTTTDNDDLFLNELCRGSNTRRIRAVVLPRPLIATGCSHWSGAGLRISTCPCASARLRSATLCSLELFNVDSELTIRCILGLHPAILVDTHSLYTCTLHPDGPVLCASSSVGSAPAGVTPLNSRAEQACLTICT